MLFGRRNDLPSFPPSGTGPFLALRNIPYGGFSVTFSAVVHAGVNHDWKRDGSTTALWTIEQQSGRAQGRAVGLGR